MLQLFLIPMSSPCPSGPMLFTQYPDALPGSYRHMSLTSLLKYELACIIYRGKKLFWREYVWELDRQMWPAGTHDQGTQSYGQPQATMGLTDVKGRLEWHQGRFTLETVSNFTQIDAVAR